MRSLLVLEAEILKGSVDGVKNYLEDLDRKTANDAFKLLGEHLGLTILEIDGICYAHLGRASQIMGYTDPSSLSQLTRAYQIMTPKIGWFEDETRSRIRETFNLDPKDSQATFVPYAGFLIAGMSGTTDGAKKIKLYLLEAERVARIGIATLDQFKLEMYRLKRIEKIITFASKLTNMPDSPYKDEAIGAFECLTGKTFPRSRQLKLPGI